MDEGGEPLALSVQLGAALYVCARERNPGHSTYKVRLSIPCKEASHPMGMTTIRSETAFKYYVQNFFLASC